MSGINNPTIYEIPPIGRSPSLGGRFYCRSDVIGCIAARLIVMREKDKDEWNILNILFTDFNVIQCLVGSYRALSEFFNGLLNPLIL